MASPDLERAGNWRKIPSVLKMLWEGLLSLNAVKASYRRWFISPVPVRAGD